MDTNLLKEWFENQKRDLPWRRSPSPYAVWISEVMLQQTQVSVVIPYFQRWMERFPTIKSLASASLDEVIKMWEGLGYYSRARYLHEGAQFICTHYDGELPSDEQKLKKIKGLGPYTIGAILSFAFHQKKAAVDGNVIRVLTRFFGIKEDISKPSTIKLLQKKAEEILPENESWLVNEGLIELGATVCQKKASCSKCPLRKNCYSYINNEVSSLPIKSKRIQTEYLYRAVIVIKHEDHFLIKRGRKGEIMHDLHEFPFIETSVESLTDDQILEFVKKVYGLNVKQITELSDVSHSFTRFQVRLDPFLIICQKRLSVENMEWMSLKSLKKLAFSSGHRRIFQQVQDISDD
ncbi:MAG: A/G-specific adenine glycosylase [Parachlamydiaceae bacterium]|nr:A/G-specific adenine glycosylase [Parachlamydiaceae bacterium]